MKSIEQKNDRLLVGLFLCAQGLLPLASIVLFSQRYHYSWRTVCYHVVFILCGYGLLLGAASLLSAARAVRSRAASRYVLPLAWGGLTVALYFSDLLAWGGRLGMGMNLTPSLVLPYVCHPSLAISTLAVPAPVFWSVLVGLPSAILVIYAIAARAFSAVGLRLGVRLRRLKRVRLSPLRQCQFLAAACVPVAAICAMFCLWPPPLSVMFGDPIFVSLTDKNILFPISGLNGTSEAESRAYVTPTDFRRKNVILVVLDACRADHLGVLGYERDTTPFLDSLRRTGHLRAARSFYSASCCTFGGIMTLLRAQDWFKMTQHAFALQDVLKSAGYRVHFILGGDHINFQFLKLYYGTNLDSYSDGSSGRHFDLNDDRGVFESFDALAASDGTPAFLYFHLMSVHPLGPRLSANVRYKPASVKKEPGYYLNNYDNGIIQADGYIRDLFARLEQKGYLQNSVVIITGDHGESLGERNVYGHTLNLYPEETTPPLLIYDPDPVMYPGLDFARQIDVAPTILDRLGLPIPASWDGHSLLRTDPARFSYLRIADTYAVVEHSPERTLKYIYDARTKREELYDETRDPHDLQDIFPFADQQEIQTLRGALGAGSIHPGS